MSFVEFIHNDIDFKIVVTENSHVTGAKSKFGFELHPLGRSKPSPCLFQTCSYTSKNKQGLCVAGKHKIVNDLLVEVKDINGNPVSRPTMMECVRAIREYEKRYNEDRFLGILEKLSADYIGRPLPPYSIYKGVLKGFYDTAGNLFTFPAIDTDVYDEAFEDIERQILAIFPDGSNACQERFPFSNASTLTYPFRFYILLFSWLVLVEEINRGDRWIYKNCYSGSVLPKYSGGAMPIIQYWIYRFKWGSDIAEAKTRIPVRIDF